MASVTINFSNVRDSLIRKTSEAIKEASFLRDIAETVITNSKASARLGKDPKTLRDYPYFTGENVEKYIARRAFLARSIVAGPNFRSRRQNLTITGELINSASFKIVGSSISFYHRGEHRPYYTGQKPVSNSDLAKWHTEGAGGYPARRVFGISPLTMKIVKNKTNAQIRRKILSIRR